jgi:hypothetical protein
VKQETGMTEPDKIRAEALHADPDTTGLVPLDSLDPRSVEPIQPQAPPYVQEPLFNKKVMLAWAFGAAAVWFAVKMIVPIAIESAKTAVVESVQEVNKQHPGSTVTITRNGKVITITRTEPAAPPTATATPAAPATSAAPPAPTKVVAPPSHQEKAPPTKK